MCIAVPQKLKSVLGEVRDIIVLPSHLFEQFEEVEPTTGVDGSDWPVDFAVLEPRSTDWITSCQQCREFIS
jgi:hypothetical protein